MNQQEPAMNLTTYGANDKVINKPGFLESRFSKSTVKNIKLFGFFFQHIFLEIALPLILYFSLKSPLGELYAAIMSAIPSLISTIWTIVIKRRFEPLPMFLILTFFIGLGLSLGLNDAKLNQIQGPIITGGIGISYIITLGFKKPIIYYFSRPWVTRNDPDKIREFDKRWDNPYFRNAMKTVSIVWGLAFILQAVANTVLIFTVSLDLVMILGNVLIFGTIGLLIIWTYIFKTTKIKETQKQLQQAQP